LQEILNAIEAESNEEEPTWSEVFSNATKTRNLHRVVLGMGPYMMNQWSGSKYKVSFSKPPEWFALRSTWLNLQDVTRSLIKEMR
jgi:hypothetical protein